jgi:hypothetical protein
LMQQKYKDLFYNNFFIFVYVFSNNVFSSPTNTNTTFQAF